MLDSCCHIEKAIVVGAFIKGALSKDERELIMQEMVGLAKTAGLEVLCCIQTIVEQPRAGTFFGQGKVQEISDLCETLDADVVVFQLDLSPVQQRNFERFSNRKVLNRTELILDIFAQHAHSRSGRLQVELAQLRYRLSHLTGRGVLMSRLGGGIGTRGPGETQLETDRRSIQFRISKLKQELTQLGKHRTEQRKSRIRAGLPVVSLVGYTNAGKSSLLNALTDSKVTAEDQLFTTLDPTTRKLPMPNGIQVLLTDTVGFIRDMPQELKVTFRATLEEIKTSALILLVVEVTCPAKEQKIESARQILKELEVLDRPILTVFNKADMLEHDTDVMDWLRRYQPSCLVSAATGEGLPELIRLIGNLAAGSRRHVHLRLPIGEGSLRSQIHKEGKVLAESFGESCIEMECEVPLWLLPKFERFLADREQTDS